MNSEEQSLQYELLVSDAKKLLEAVKRKASERGFEIKTALTWGKPAQKIVEQAIEGEFDQIVIGSHSRRGLARLLFGSISESVVRPSPVSVIVVRHTEDMLK